MIMTNKKKYVLLICLAQIAGILMWLLIIQLFNTQNMPNYIIFGAPLLLASFMSFVLSSCSSVRINFRESIICFIPATVVYILVYVLIPEIDIASGNYAMGFFYTIYNLLTFYMPLIILAFAINSLAIWIGSLFHNKLFK